MTTWGGGVEVVAAVVPATEGGEVQVQESVASEMDRHVEERQTLGNHLKVTHP